ncbi:unnamed protein product [Mytilus edulis]|uniref:DUF6451 domain-containing protein n=1 Tax=Mytilus edulis TaxID=6550 RepID=A0A8S3Q119_MYTED|nr:unnamed protein product [Mytilus edulis]
MTRRPMKLFSPKYPTKIGTWNVRTLYQSGKSLQTAKEMDRYSIEILGLSEVRWNTSGMTTNGVTENQIDHIAISQRWRSSLQDVRNKRGADIASDHHLIIAKIQLKLLSTKKAKSRRKKFNVDLFKDPKVVQDYHILLQNKFGVLENLHDEETSINTAWEMTRDSIVQACEETVGYLQQNRKQWMSENTWKIVNERRQVKEKVLTAITRQQKKQTQEQYSNKDTEVKKSCKQDKRNFVEQLAKEAEAACSKGDTKTLYNITKQLSGKPPTSNTPIKDKDNNTLTKLEDQLERSNALRTSTKLRIFTTNVKYVLLYGSET